jgi:CDP-diacylglycerol--serine O-phosphatidyltransferase
MSKIHENKKHHGFEDYYLRKLINLPSIITFLNLLGGIASIYFAFNEQFMMSSIMLFFAVIMDYFDGKVANLLDKKTAFGKEIDSLSDIVSFGIAPIIFGCLYYMSRGEEASIFLFIAVFFFILAGVIRLARYNIMDYTEGFMGMPITLNGIIFPVFYLTSIPFAGVYMGLPFLYLSLGTLMISPIKIKRFT